MAEADRTVTTERRPDDPGRTSSWASTAADVVRDTRRRAAGRDLTLIAAGLALYAGIAIVPLLLVGLWGAGLVLGAERVATLVARIADFAPATFGASGALRDLGSIGPRLGVPSLVASLLTATTYGEGLLRAVDLMTDTRRARRSLMGRLRSLPYLGAFPLVTVLGLGTVAVLPDMLGMGGGSRVLGVYVTFWVGWLSAATLVGLLYWLFATRPLGAAALALSALATGSFLAGMSLGWVLVLRYGVAVGRAYGGSEQIGGVVLFAIYLVLVQVVVLVGYLLALSIEDRGRSRSG